MFGQVFIMGSSLRMYQSGCDNCAILLACVVKQKRDRSINNPEGITKEPRCHALLRNMALNYIHTCACKILYCDAAFRNI